MKNEAQIYFINKYRKNKIRAAAFFLELHKTVKKHKAFFIRPKQTVRTKVFVFIFPTN